MISTKIMLLNINAMLSLHFLICCVIFYLTVKLLQNFWAIAVCQLSQLVDTASRSLPFSPPPLFSLCLSLPLRLSWQWTSSAGPGTVWAALYPCPFSLLWVLTAAWALRLLVHGRLPSSPARPPRGLWCLSFSPAPAGRCPGSECPVTLVSWEPAAHRSPLPGLPLWRPLTPAFLQVCNWCAIVTESLHYRCLFGSPLTFC